jgi:hypothetical protein
VAATTAAGGENHRQNTSGRSPSYPLSPRLSSAPSCSRRKAEQAGAADKEVHGDGGAPTGPFASACALRKDGCAAIEGTSGGVLCRRAQCLECAVARLLSAGGVQPA